MSEVEQTPPAETPVGGIVTETSSPIVSSNSPEVVKLPPNPEAVAKTNELMNTVRISANFSYERVTDVVKELLDIGDVPAGKITDDQGRQISMIRFEDEPLRFCLERLRHLVSGRCEVNDQGAVDFEAFTVEVKLSEVAPNSFEAK